jgi:hypothetical protein
LERAQDQCLTICLPDIRSIQDDLILDSEFFDLHILREQVDEGWYQCCNPNLPLIVELEGKNRLKLLSAPNYHPSFQKGLYYTTISDVILGANQVIDAISVLTKFLNNYKRNCIHFKNF